MVAAQAMTKHVSSAHELRESLDTGNAVATVKNTVATVRQHLASLRSSSIPLPRIDPRTHQKHFQFAVMVANGYSYQDACEIVECSPRTAERWRKELCASAREHYGFNVEYAMVARDVVEAEINRINARNSSSVSVSQK